MSQTRVAIVSLSLGCLVAAGLAAAADPEERAQVLYRAGDRDAARAVLDSLLSAPGDPRSDQRLDAAFLRARYESDGFRYEERLRSLLSSEQRKGRRSAIHLALGHLAFARGDLALALADFQAAREGGGDEAHFWHGLTAFALGDAGAAREALDKAAGSRDKSLRHRALVVIGDTHRLAGRYEDAAEVYEKVRDEAPAGSGWWGTAVLQEARCRMETGETALAAELLQLVMTQAPGGYDAPVAHAWLRDMAHPPAPPSEAEEAAQFSLQVGAFAVRANAESLVERVRAAGFSPVRIDRRDDELYRVLLGNYTERARAEAVGDSVSTALGLGYSVVGSSR